MLTACPFAAEAKALASLNHPNIAAIYGLGSGGTNFLILEPVQGQRRLIGLKLDPFQVEESLELAYSSPKPSNGWKRASTGVT
jgi:hypothetical protein